MSITPTGSSTSSTPLAGAVDRGTLGKDDFLKLLVGQMKNQDPLSPTDQNEYMGQMTQFSILEQITNLTAATTKMAGAIDRERAAELVGRTVTYNSGADGATAQGVVEKVTFLDGTPMLTVGGQAGIDLGAIVEVA